MQYAMVSAAISGDWAMAAEFASRVAPYRHARLSSVTNDTTIRRNITEMSDDELAALAGNDVEESESESEGGA